MSDRDLSHRTVVGAVGAGTERRRQAEGTGDGRPSTASVDCRQVVTDS